jgi:2-succinyl-6-hydroxy-2,4-cyclohexadiene-1-carboxylate synthase
MIRLPINGLHYNVEIAGGGRKLVLLHGFTGSADTWQPFVERFQATHQVISIELLGHGQSDCPSDPMRYRVERQIDDLTTVLQQLEIGDYDLLGYSMGGRLALHVALVHGARVTGLILESASPGIEPAEERASRIRHDESLATMLDREGIDAFVEYWERLPLFASQISLPAETRLRLRRQRLSSSPIGLAGSLRGFGAGVPEALWDRLHQLPPTLLMAGESDEKYANLARRMGNLIPESTIAIVPGAGHTVHLEKPDEFAHLVTKFIGRGRSPCLPFVPTANYVR